MADAALDALGLSDSFKALATVLVDEEAVDGVLELMVSLARGINGVDEASVSAVCTRDLETISASSDQVREVDECQYQTGEGPCVAAIAEGRTYNVHLDTMEERWPQFVPIAVASGFGSILSVPLAARERTIGALNLYSRSQRVFGDDDVSAAQLFAEHASVVLANAMAYAASETTNRHLETALETARLIGRAQGVLMARQACSSEEAFEMLRRASQRTNRKLREVAEEIVAPLERRSHAAS